MRRLTILLAGGLLGVVLVLLTPGAASADLDGQQVIDVAAGDDQSCAVTETGGLYCWGDNGDAALGIGTSGGIDLSSPQHVVGVTNAVSVDSIDELSCLLNSVGGLQCWGDNTREGTGTGQIGGDVFVPTDVVGLTSGVISYSVGDEFACAVVTGGQAKCWGENEDGQLGIGSTSTSETVPTDVSGLSNATMISAGEQHACALTESGGVKCWGEDRFGSLGDGPGQSDSTIPVDVAGLTSGVESVAVGDDWSCAILEVTGAVKCWGYNGDGVLGDGTMTDAFTPIDVVGLPGPVAALALGDDHSCARLVAGTLYCWGQNRDAELGLGTQGDDVLTPTMVPGLTDVVDVDAGDGHTCVATAGGSAKCWGDNRSGEVGNGDVFHSPVPIPVVGLGTSIVLSANEDVSCAVDAAGAATCWGEGTSQGRLGDGTGDSSGVPVPVVGLSAGVLGIDGAENSHTCAIVAGNGLRCWGSGFVGQLGNGGTGSSAVPVDVTGLASGVTDVSAGGALGTTCAVVDGGVMCWGYGTTGQLGDGTTPFSQSTPVTPTGLGPGSGIVQVSVGGDHVCALTDLGAVKCWGANFMGQYGSSAQSNTPIDVPEFSAGIAAVTAGRDHTCVLTTGGAVKCVGGNSDGQLGDGTTDDSTTPVDVVGLGSGVTAIDTSDVHTCATTATAMMCWGDNRSGQLGDGTLVDRSAPVTVVGLTGAPAAFSAGEALTCASTAAEGTTCWGGDDFGGLGAGATPYVLSPFCVNEPPPPGGSRIFLSSTSGGSVDGVVFADEDIVVFDTLTETWAMAFDGSDVGLTTADVDGFHVISESPLEILMSFTTPRVIPGIGAVDDSDLVRFTGTGGLDTAGSFSWELDGSDVDLATTNEDIDAVAVLEATDLVLSTIGNVTIPGLPTLGDEDILRYEPVTPAPDSVGTFSLHYDFSDLGMASEDVTAASIDQATEWFYGAAFGSYTIDGYTGDGDDIFVFSGEAGFDTSGVAVGFFDGDLHGYGGEQIDGLTVMPGVPSSSAADVGVDITDDAGGNPVSSGDTVTFTVDVSNEGPNTATGLELQLTLPPALTLVETIGCGEDPSGVPTCTLPDLGAGGSDSVQLVTTVEVGFVGPAAVSVVASADELDTNTADNSDSAQVTVEGPATSLTTPLYLSSTSSGSVGGVSFADEDIVVFDPSGQTWAMAFDGSDVGLARNDIDGFSIVSVADPLVLDFTLISPITLPGVGTVDDSDVVRFTGTGGPDTAGTFSLVFDGSDVAMAAAAEDLDALATVEGPCPALLLSTTGNTNGLSVDGRDEDFLAFLPTTLGDPTAGTFEMLFDGSDVGATSGDLVGLALSDNPSVIYGAGLGTYTVAGFTGDRNDVFAYTGSFGASTVGTADRLWDGDAFGFGSEQIDGVHVELPGQAALPGVLVCPPV